MPRLLILTMSIGLAVSACSPPPAPAAAPARPAAAIAWTQFGLGDTPDLVARALVDRADDCPTIEWDGGIAPMTLRSPDRIKAFGKLCEKRLTLGEALKVRIRLGGAVLLEQQITRRPERIAVLGDTGCRVTYYADQGCTKPENWPFATVAAAAAAKQPDLILHLGDYYYREVPCLAVNTDCKPGPYGDREETWRAEFFEPGRALIARAPWVFVRGNHEDCQRGGYGWAYYFGDESAACDVTHKTAHIRLNGLTLVNFDTAQTANGYLVGDMNRNWTSLANRLDRRPPATPGEAILLMTHEPGYFVCVNKDKNVLQTCQEPTVGPISGVRLIADAARRSGWRTILLSGHIHAFQTVDASPMTLGGGQSVTQVVVGTSGANQDEDPTPSAMVPPAAVDTTFDDVRLVPQGDPNNKKTKWVAKDSGVIPIKVQGWTDFGFGMLTPSSLELAMFDRQGRPKFTCALADETKTPRCR